MTIELEIGFRPVSIVQLVQATSSAVTLLPFHAMSEDSEKTIKMIIDHMAKNKFQFEGELANCLL